MNWKIRSIISDLESAVSDLERLSDDDDDSLGDEYKFDNLPTLNNHIRLCEVMGLGEKTTRETLLACISERV